MRPVSLAQSQPSSDGEKGQIWIQKVPDGLPASAVVGAADALGDNAEGGLRMGSLDEPAVAACPLDDEAETRSVKTVTTF